MGTYKMCVCFTRKFKGGDTEPPVDVKKAFANYSESGYMGAEHLRRFIVEVQREVEVSIKDAENIIDQIRHRRHLGKFKKPVLSLDDFFHYLFCPDLNPPMKSEYRRAK